MQLQVIDISRSHLQAVLEWNSCDDKGEFDDLVIHLVREHAHVREAADAHEA